ncbi:hypothetical protein K435DRAFT_879227 [Dendrothele bispora CBS 962.96]|uniref:Uncharacterized protein n=1 Tax=Dendrothele bispora (strain CBS 962.96) TaxID=1314807 RepID=A0A4S8KLH8_DENBC|nr:hypothetical protein K435DRAFT_879227 [Dendrothele bispora CBS 962.96]
MDYHRDHSHLALPYSQRFSTFTRTNDQQKLSVKRKCGRPSTSPRSKCTVKRTRKFISSSNINDSSELLYPDEREDERSDDQDRDQDDELESNENEEDVNGNYNEGGLDDEDDKVSAIDEVEQGDGIGADQEEDRYSESEFVSDNESLIHPSTPSHKSVLLPSPDSERIDAYGDLWHNFKYNVPDECEVLTSKNKDKDLEKLGIYSDRPPVKHSAMLNYNKSDINAGSMIWSKVIEMYPKKGQLDIVFCVSKLGEDIVTLLMSMYLLSTGVPRNTSSGSRVEFLQTAEFTALSTCHGPSKIFLSVGQVLSSSLVEPRPAGSRALSEKALRSITLTHLPTEYSYAASVFGNTLEDTSYIGPLVYETLHFGDDGTYLVGGLQYTTRMGPWKGYNVQKPPMLDELQKYESVYSTTASSFPTKSDPNSPYKTKPLNTVELQRATFHKTSMDVNEHINQQSKADPAASTTLIQPVAKSDPAR